MQSLIVMYITSVQYIVSSLHYCYKQDVWWTCRCLWHMHITTCINYQHDFDYVTKTIIATAHIIVTQLLWSNTGIQQLTRMINVMRNIKLYII